VSHEGGVVDSVKLAEKGGQIASRRFGIVARDVQLCPVAGRHHGRFARYASGYQRPQCAVETTRVKVDPFTQPDRRGSVVDSDYEQMHIDGQVILSSGTQLLAPIPVS
jgi:hypothetical protein